MLNTPHRYQVHTFVLGCHFSTLTLTCAPEQLDRQLALAVSMFETAQVRDLGIAPRFVVEASNPSYGSGEWFPWFTGEREGRIAVFVSHVEADTLRRTRAQAVAGYTSYRVVETFETDEQLVARTLRALAPRLGRMINTIRPFVPRVRCPKCSSTYTVDRVEKGAEGVEVVAALCNGCESVIEVQS